MKVDIFIPTSNRIDSLTSCLQSLNNQTKKDFRILLVGLSQNDQVFNLITQYSNLKIEYFVQKNAGLINAANEALARSNSDIFVRLDDDVILDSVWYENLIATYLLGNDIGGVTGPTIMSDTGIKSRDLTHYLNILRTSKNPLLKFMFSLYNNFIYENKIMEVSTFLPSGVFTLGSNYISCLANPEIKEVSNLEACNWSARTGLLKQIGGFDSVYLKGLGDFHEADAALRIKQLGYRLVFNPKVKLQHNVEQGDVVVSRPRAYYRIQNFIIFYFRFFKIISITQLLKFSTNLMIQDMYYILTFLKSRDISQLGALVGTFVGLFRVIFQYEN